MMKTMISSKKCYEGYDSEEKCFVFGDYNSLFEDVKIKRDSIQFSLDAWEDEKGYFKDYLDKVVADYEKENKAVVTDIGLIGSVGVWTGNHLGGTIIEGHENPLEHMGDVDDIEVVAHEDGQIQILGHHHDGTHRMNIYLLTEDVLEKYAPDYLTFGDYGVEDLKKIADNTKSITFDHVAKKYFGEMEVKKKKDQEITVEVDM